MRGPALLAALVFVAAFAGREARAQQRGSDVGGQPSRRAITKYPKLVRFVEATYPPAEKAAGHEAQVILIISISATGEVTSVEVKESAGAAFDAEIGRAHV